MKEVANVSSLLPGTSVQSLVTSTSPLGLNVQVVGTFSGTIDLYQIPLGDMSKYEVGSKVKARILYEIPGSSPPQFALSLSDHVLALQPKKISDINVADSFPVGTHLSSVKVKRVESERGLVVSIQDGIEGFVHVRFEMSMHSNQN